MRPFNDCTPPKSEKALSERGLKLRWDNGAAWGASLCVREYLHDEDALFVRTAHELHVRDTIRQEASGEQGPKAAADPLHGYDEGSLRRAGNVMGMSIHGNLRYEMDVKQQPTGGAGWVWLEGTACSGGTRLIQEGRRAQRPGPKRRVINRPAG